MKEIITFEPPNTIVLTFRGVLDAAEVDNMFEKWNNYVKPGQKQNVLLCANELEDLPPKTREALRRGGLKFEISKMAIYGATTKLRIMGGLIIKMLPNISRSTFVKTEEEAREWLNKQN